MYIYLVSTQPYPLTTQHSSTEHTAVTVEREHMFNFSMPNGRPHSSKQQRQSQRAQQSTARTARYRAEQVLGLLPDWIPSSIILPGKQSGMGNEVSRGDDSAVAPGDDQQVIEFISNHLQQGACRLRRLTHAICIR